MTSKKSRYKSKFRDHLSASIFPDVGPVTARKIVAKYGIESANIIDTAPARLLDIYGIGVIRMHSVVTGWSMQHRPIHEADKLIVSQKKSHVRGK